MLIRKATEDDWINNLLHGDSGFTYQELEGNDIWNIIETIPYKDFTITVSQGTTTRNQNLFRYLLLNCEGVILEMDVDKQRHDKNKLIYWADMYYNHPHIRSINDIKSPGFEI